MATTIAEPNDLPDGSITPETEDYYELLVYQKAADNAGIKKMKIAGWRTYLNFNSHKVNNVASYIDPDINTNYPNWDSNTDSPYTGVSIVDRIANLGRQAGIDPETSTTGVPSLKDYIEQLQTEVETASTGLLDRMTAAEGDITTIYDLIGAGGSTPSTPTINSRLTALETTVGNSSHGLVKDVTDLKTTVGDSSSGLVQSVTALNATVNDSSTGLVARVGSLETDVNDPTTGLTTKVAQNTTDIETLKTTVSSAYKYKGSVKSADANGIYVGNDSTFVAWANIENGNVYNVDPATSTSMTIKGKTYNKGTNIAWVVNEDNFDELAMTIDVAALDELKNRFVDEAELGSSNPYWTSNGKNLTDGTYIFSLTNLPPTSGGSSLFCSFILAFRDGTAISTTPGTLSGTFNDHFNINANGDLILTNKGAGNNAVFSYFRM